MGCPAYSSFSPLPLILDHLANTLASSLLPSFVSPEPATPLLALGTLLPESSSSSWLPADPIYLKI